MALCQWFYLVKAAKIIKWGLLKVNIVFALSISLYDSGSYFIWLTLRILIFIISCNRGKLKLLTHWRKDSCFHFCNRRSSILRSIIVQLFFEVKLGGIEFSREHSITNGGITACYPLSAAVYCNVRWFFEVTHIKLAVCVLLYCSLWCYPLKLSLRNLVYNHSRSGFFIYH